MAKMKRQRKECKISEANMASLSQRYTAVTVLGLLREVAQYVGGVGRAAAGGKIDWEALAKSTTTGISNPREYQMLWRQLAYRHPLSGNLEDETQSLDDDSDLECEVEAFPNVDNEASSEAAAFVKVLMASGPPNDSSHLNGSMVEAPLIINIPCTQSYEPASEGLQPSALRGMNITVPVFVPKVPLTGGAASSVDHMDANGSSDKKKRKAWTKEEDVLLIEAVKEFGAGNWEPIKVKTGLDRTTTQLSQRWAHLRRKKPGACNLGRDAGTHLFEQQQAARHAMNLALDPRRNSNLNNSGSNETLTTQHQSLQNPSVINPRSALDKNTAAVKLELPLDRESKTAQPAGARNSQLDALLPANRIDVLPAQHQSQQLQSMPRPAPVCVSGSVGKPHSTSDKDEALVKSESSLDVAGCGAHLATQSNVEPPPTRTEALIAQRQPLHLTAMSKPSNPPTLGSVAKPHLSMGSMKSLAPGCAPTLSEANPGECTGEETSTTERMENSGQDVLQDSEVPVGKEFISVNELAKKCEVDAGSQIVESVMGSQHAVASGSKTITELDTLEGNLMKADCNSAEDVDMADDNETLVVVAKKSENHSEVPKPKEDQKLSCEHAVPTKGHDGSCGKSEELTTAGVSNGLVKEQN